MCSILNCTPRCMEQQYIERNQSNWYTCTDTSVKINAYYSVVVLECMDIPARAPPFRAHNLRGVLSPILGGSNRGLSALRSARGKVLGDVSRRLDREL